MSADNGGYRVHLEWGPEIQKKYLDAVVARDPAEFEMHYGLSPQEWLRTGDRMFQGELERLDTLGEADEGKMGLIGRVRTRVPEADHNRQVLDALGNVIHVNALEIEGKHTFLDAARRTPLILRWRGRQVDKEAFTAVISAVIASLEEKGNGGRTHHVTPLTPDTDR